MTKNENKIVKRAAGMVWDQVWVHFLHQTIHEQSAAA
jgi:hypothetical protein